MKNLDNFTENNKRDYDKNPLIVKNYIKFANIVFIVVFFILFFLFIVFVGIEPYYRSGSFGIGMFAGLGYILYELNDKNLDSIIFYNKFIKFKINNEWEKIEILSIEKISRNCSNSYLNIHKIKISNSLIIFSIVIVFLTFILVKDYKSAFVIVILPIISYFLARFILFVFINKTVFGYKIFNSLAIYNSKNFFNKNIDFINMLSSKNQFIEMKQYFLEKTDMNIEKTQYNFSVF